MLVIPIKIVIRREFYKNCLTMLPAHFMVSEEGKYAS